ncbi:MAG: hypothetical protein A2173_00320 [Planctomycetes bacterium RBG_13_44_8b]|nr:MAG: hypothetical protein A2173_00320 [Planctomycetes bacterium RBG_13_44_8b]
MKWNLKKIGSGNNRLFNRLAAEKKKSFLAVCLIVFMIFMWVRIFAKKTPGAAHATLTNTKASRKGQDNPQIKVSYIELPRIQGRNDVIKMDFFDPKGWRGFVQEGKDLTDGQKTRIGHNSIDRLTRLMQAELKLEAIELGESPCVFINGRLLSTGDKLILKEGNDVYECEVSRIEKNLVVVNCGEVEVQLKFMSED